MIVRFKESFARDLRALKEGTVLSRIKSVIEAVEQAGNPGDIRNLKKLRGGGSYYRIRSGNYRIGLLLEGEVVTLVRCLHRGEIYKYFP